MRENNYPQRFFLLLLIAFWGTHLNAAHLVGGEVTYKCLGYTNDNPSSNSRNYEFTINVFRDCQGGGDEFDGPNFVVRMHITVYQGNTQFGVYVLDAPVVERIDATLGNCIDVPGNVCIEQGSYIFTLDLPIVEETYQIVYQRCCRNNTITNIFSPESSGSTYTIALTPDAQATCNNSPVFSEYPPAVLCVNEAFSYDFSAEDADGDLLVYQFCSPFLGGAIGMAAPDPDFAPPYQNVTFLAPNYTATLPLGASATLLLNSSTGLMTGTPQFTGQFVVGVCVSEYRNGLLLSTVRRDFQFNVTSCEVLIYASLARDSINMAGEFVVSSCGETEVGLLNTSGQTNLINNYLWSFDVNGELITSDQRNFTYDFPGLGSYHGKMIINQGEEGCTDSISVLVQVFPGLHSDFSFEYDSCVAEPVVFTNLSTTDGGQNIIQHEWRFDDGENSEERSPVHPYTIPGVFEILLRETDENGCKDIKTKTINYFPVPNLIVIAPNSFIGCEPANIFFDNLSTPIDESYIFDWDFGDGSFSDELSPTHSYDVPGLYTIFLAITSPIGCTTDTFFNDLIKIYGAPVAGFDLDTLVLSSFNPEIHITDASIDANNWFYDMNGETTNVNPSFSYMFQDTGKAYITQIVTHITGCQDSITKVVDVKPEITFYFPNAFTPNGDGTNDVFKPIGVIQDAKDFQMRIWNRWGEPMFTSTDPAKAWNGRKNNVGINQPLGVYLYEAYLTGPRGESFKYKGVITLIR